MVFVPMKRVICAALIAWHNHACPALVCALCVWIVLLCWWSFAATLPFESEIPSSSVDATLRMEEGALDSSLWSSLEPFYDRPLLVPAGELVQLVELFPDISTHIPAGGTVLDQYLPWNKSAVDRFFRDYPVLERFRPVLCFDYSDQSRAGALSLFMDLSQGDTTEHHTLRLNAGIGKQLSLRSSFDVTSDYVLLKRLSLTAKPASWIKIEAGNVTFLHDQGILYGYFPKSQVSDGDNTSNHLLDTPFWNGCSVSGSIKEKNSGIKSSVTYFMHKRYTESIIGGNASVSFANTLFFSMGASCLDAIERHGKGGSLHGSVSTSFQLFRSELFWGAQCDCPLRIPVVWKNRFCGDKQTVDIRFTSLPEGFNASRSGLLHSAKSILELSDTLSIAIKRVEFTVTDKISRPFYLKPDVDLWFGGRSVTRADLRMQCAGRFSRVETRLSLTYGIRRDEFEVQPFSIEDILRIDCASFLSAECRNRFSGTNGGGFRYSGSFVPSLSFFSSALRLAPSLQVVVKERTCTSFLVGCKEGMTICGRATTELFFEKDLAKAASKSVRSPVRIRARATYCF